ncbi:ABC transporter permease [Kitasatospora aureofaciens]|uniref:ABC transporter permease n=1 Tax=Kitasatospora aureofaciens TaxID=1894 RepID=UPI0036F474BA
MAAVDTVAVTGTATRPAAPSLLRRVLRDRVGAAASAAVLLFLLLALGAPLIAALYGKNPVEHYGRNVPGLLSDGSLPIPPNGGISGEYWFGLEPGLGRDVLTQLLYGIRTSLLIALASAAVTTALGVLAGVAVGYPGGTTDRLFGFLASVLLAFPTLLLLLAPSPVIQSRLVDPGAAEPEWMQFLVLVLVFSAFGWIPLALSLRASVRSLRERDFVRSTRAQGAGRFHVVVHELLPNVRSQLLVHATMAVPTFVASEAAPSGTRRTRAAPAGPRLPTEFIRSTVRALPDPNVSGQGEIRHALDQTVARRHRHRPAGDLLLGRCGRHRLRRRRGPGPRPRRPLR